MAQSAEAVTVQDFSVGEAPTEIKQAPPVQGIDPFAGSPSSGAAPELTFEMYEAILGASPVVGPDGRPVGGGAPSAQPIPAAPPSYAPPADQTASEMAEIRQMLAAIQEGLAASRQPQTPQTASAPDPFDAIIERLKSPPPEVSSKTAIEGFAPNTQTPLKQYVDAHFKESMAPVFESIRAMAEQVKAMAGRTGDAQRTAFEASLAPYGSVIKEPAFSTFLSGVAPLQGGRTFKQVLATAVDRQDAATVQDIIRLYGATRQKPATQTAAPPVSPLAKAVQPRGVQAAAPSATAVVPFKIPMNADQTVDFGALSKLVKG